MKKIYFVLTLVLAIFVLVGCQGKINDAGGMQDTTHTPPSSPPTEEVVEGVMEEYVGVTHTVDVLDDGFIPEDLEIEVGDTVKWVNRRSEGAKIKQVLIAGTSPCNKVKSSILQIGETFEYTFDKAEKCKILDGVTANQFGTVTVGGDEAMMENSMEGDAMES